MGRDFKPRRVAVDGGGVEVHSATPPVVRLTLAMLDAPDVDALARVCVDELLALFGAQSVRVVDAERVWAEASVASDAVGPTATMRLPLCDAEAPPVQLELVLPRGPDLPILRQQFLDVAAVARRAWRDRRLLGEERRRAREDALTGLENRRGIEGLLEREIAEAERAGRALTVMLIDLDHFKVVNDTEGHHAGDEVLKQAAACFREHLRPTDRVCRWGGDEFLLVLPGLAPEQAAAVADRLRRAFAASAEARGTTMSIGISDLGALDPGRCSAPMLVQLADHCLYEAKRAGRNRVCQAQPPARAAG